MVTKLQSYAFTDVTTVSFYITGRILQIMDRKKNYY